MVIEHPSIIFLIVVIINLGNFRIFFEMGFKQGVWDFVHLSDLVWGTFAGILWYIFAKVYDKFTDKSLQIMQDKYTVDMKAKNTIIEDQQKTINDQKDEIQNLKHTVTTLECSKQILQKEMELRLK